MCRKSVSHGIVATPTEKPQEDLKENTFYQGIFPLMVKTIQLVSHGYFTTQSAKSKDKMKKSKILINLYAKQARNFRACLFI